MYYRLVSENNGMPSHHHTIKPFKNLKTPLLPKPTKPPGKYSIAPILVFEFWFTQAGFDDAYDAIQHILHNPVGSETNQLLVVNKNPGSIVYRDKLQIAVAIEQYHPHTKNRKTELEHILVG